VVFCGEASLGSRPGLNPARQWVRRWFDITAVRNQNRYEVTGLNGTNGGGESRIAMHHFVKESRIAAAPGVVFAAGEGQARREAT